MCAQVMVWKSRKKEKEKHPRSVSVIGEYREGKTNGRSGVDLIRLPKKPEMIGPSIPGIYKRFSIY